MRRTQLGTGLVLCLASLAMLAPGASAGTGRHRTLIVLAGQSNALGWQSYAIDPATGINYLGPRYRTRADRADGIAWDSWPVVSYGQVARRLDAPQVIDTGQQIFGPEIGFARQLYVEEDKPVTIVKVAWADTTLATDWSPVSGFVFTQLVNTVHAQIASDAKRGITDTVGGFLWYQGESDASSAAYSSSYQANLAAFLGAVRSAFVPTARIVVVKESLAALIASKEAAGACATCATLAAGDTAVRAADDWAAADLSNVVTVDSAGLPRVGLGIHLSDLSELVLGQAMARAFDAP